MAMLSLWILDNEPEGNTDQSSGFQDAYSWDSDFSVQSMDMERKVYQLGWEVPLNAKWVSGKVQKHLPFQRMENLVRQGESRVEKSVVTFVLYYVAIKS